jgi:hypothetical protein
LMSSGVAFGGTSTPNVAVTFTYNTRRDTCVEVSYLITLLHREALEKMAEHCCQRGYIKHQTQHLCR